MSGAKQHAATVASTGKRRRRKASELGESKPSDAPRPIPGLEVVGRGIYLHPYRPYALAQLLFMHKEMRVIRSNETKGYYTLPVDYEVNDSPPFPMNESLNQVIIEESWDRFEKQMGIDANASVGNAAFSVSATASWNSSLRSEQEAYYAIRSSFVPLWTLYIPNPNECIDEIRDLDIPAPFSPAHRRTYEAFFRQYGSHYVRGAWVGGKSTLVFTVLKSSQLGKQDIQAGIKASLGSRAGGINSKHNETREKLLSSSQCTVIGRGGDEVLLAEMSSLDQDAYNKWLATIPDNPQVTEIDVAGIWTLVRDPAKATALMAAYREAVVFEPIKAAFEMEHSVYFIRGNQFVRYDRVRRTTSIDKPLHELMPGIDEMGFERIDSAFSGKYLRDADGAPLDAKLFLFRRDRVLRFDFKSQSIDPGFPKPIQEVFPGLPFNRVDAALVANHDEVYFFLGSQYARFNPVKNRIDEGYPQPIFKRWVGVTFDRIDASVYWGNGKVYFFRGDQHIRYDLTNYRSDPGFPKHVVGNYIEDWQFIDG